MTLVWWELKKILRRRLTKVLLAICLALVVVESVALGFGNYGFGTAVASPTWEARTRIVQATRDAAAWHGPLTAETLLAARMENEFPVLLCLFGVLVFLRALATGGLLRGVPDAVVQTLPFLTHLGDLTGNTMITLPGGQALLMALYRLATQPLYLVVLLPLAWRAYVRRQVR